MTLAKLAAAVPTAHGRRRSTPSSDPRVAEPAGELGLRGDASETLQRVALDLFAKQNYATVTIKDIAKATGFNPSLIYYYFGSKEGLFLKAIERTVDDAFQHFASISDRTKDPIRIISLWIEVHITQYVKLQKLAKISLDYASNYDRTDPADQAIRKFYDREAAVLGAAIKAGIAAGQFNAANPRAVALFISTYLDGALFRSVLFPDFNEKAAMRQMRKIVLTYLRTGGMDQGAESELT